MLIVCPNCATSYQVEPSSLGATGRSVRCVRCRKVWFASNTEAMAAIALSHHRDMAALSGVPVTAGAMDDVVVDPFAEPPQEAADAFDRDDRGPGPLPDPRDYDIPSAPVVVDDAPALAPGDPEEAPQAAIEAVPVDIETVAARRIRKPPPRRRKSGWPVSGWAIAILLLLTANIGLVAFRDDIVRLFPQTASAYAAVGFQVNLRGLVFTDIVTRKDTHDGTSMLVVEGVIKSNRKHDIAVPRLRFALRNAKGHEIYTWTAQPTRNTIAPGTTMTFRTRLASPPPEAHAVLVRFFNRRDLVAGIQ
ncbi:MAG TPA: MJ0042-type zinc finger domain-containing protein [Xanthobacteraceae bacterium]|nr:MJ0042-type zinc finger domain-containing protein [Xanthobacteraceae bacterium]